MSTYLIGLGQVSLSFAKILKSKKEIDFDSFYCVKSDINKKKLWIEIGGNPNNFIDLKIIKENYLDFLKTLKSNDFLLDFGINLRNVHILEYCLKNNIHYLFTADSSWEDDKSWRTCYQHFLEYRQLNLKYSHNRATSVIEFGMNPGLVSIFVKKNIEEIVYNSNCFYIKLFRRKLIKLIKDKQYAKIAKLLKINLIEIVDKDTQQFKVSPKPKTIYSPWSPCAFFMEEVSSPEIVYGTKQQLLKHSKFFDVMYDELFIALPEKPDYYKQIVFNSEGSFMGSLVPHEETFSIRQYLTFNNYKPTVIFVYKASEIANQSVINNFSETKPNYFLLTKKDFISGGEEVGVIIQGKRFKTHYYGNKLDSASIDEMATIKQVSLSAFLAYKFIKDNPNKGLIFPEEIDTKYLSLIETDLNGYISIDIPKVKTTKI